VAGNEKQIAVAGKAVGKRICLYHSPGMATVVATIGVLQTRLQAAKMKT